MPKARVLVEISGHGYGHLAQTAPVLNALCRKRSDIELALRTAIPGRQLASRVRAPFRLISAETDPGLQMNSAVEVRVDRSHAAYRRYHRDWERALDRETAQMARLEPVLVLANVSYRTVAAAVRLGVPAVVMSSLNWADVYTHYCGSEDGARAIAEQIRECYRQADHLLALTPGLPMNGFPNRRTIGPVAATGRGDSARLRAALDVNPETALVLMALGGIATPFDVGLWPKIPGVVVLGAGPAAQGKPGFRDFSGVEMPFIDVLASCDAVVTKPGYGTFVEAACNGVRVLYVRRPDWPETPHLVPWLERHGVCRALDWGQLIRGQFELELRDLLALPLKPPTAAGGIETASDLLIRLLSP